jgi:hypothetical protein
MSLYGALLEHRTQPPNKFFVDLEALSASLAAVVSVLKVRVIAGQEKKDR